MLRSGVSFPALMNLGHSTPKMTLLYAEFTETDLQREFRAARSRHLLPMPKTTPTTAVQADLPGALNAVQAAQHVLEMFRRSLPEIDGSGRVLDRLVNRLTKITALLRKLAPKEQGQRLAG